MLQFVPPDDSRDGWHMLILESFLSLFMSEDIVTLLELLHLEFASSSDLVWSLIFSVVLTHYVTRVPLIPLFSKRDIFFCIVSALDILN